EEFDLPNCYASVEDGHDIMTFEQIMAQLDLDPVKRTKEEIIKEGHKWIEDKINDYDPHFFKTSHFDMNDELLVLSTLYATTDDIDHVQLATTKDEEYLQTILFEEKKKIKQRTELKKIIEKYNLDTLLKLAKMKKKVEWGVSMNQKRTYIMIDDYQKHLEETALLQFLQKKSYIEKWKEGKEKINYESVYIKTYSVADETRKAITRRVNLYHLRCLDATKPKEKLKRLFSKFMEKNREYQIALRINDTHLKLFEKFFMDEFEFERNFNKRKMKLLINEEGYSQIVDTNCDSNLRLLHEHSDLLLNGFRKDFYVIFERLS
ncbi:16683_t:CDS:2, partial [Dentiscutata erythropus]